MNSTLDSSLSTRATAQSLGTTHPTISKIAKAINEKRADRGLPAIGEKRGQCIMYTPADIALIKPLVRTQPTKTATTSNQPILLFALRDSQIPKALLSMVSDSISAATTTAGEAAVGKKGGLKAT